jgi:FkbM family methyltransferase
MANPLLNLAAWTARWLPMPVKRGLYRFPPLARALRGALNRAAPHGLTRATVAAGGLAGVELLLDLQEEKDYWLGTYEPELQAAAAELVQPGMTVYDVGANIGYVSLLLARCAGASGHVFAFEALPANLERLRANLELSGYTDRVTVVPAAVVERERPARFLVGPSGGMGKAEGSAGRQDVSYSQSLEVPGLSLDGFVYQDGNPAPQVVKMDIEGGEVLALPGMRRLLEEARPLVLLELHGQEAARAAWQVFEQARYRLYPMHDRRTPIQSINELNWKAYLVAVPSPADPIRSLRGRRRGENLMQALKEYRQDERRREP